MKSGQELHEEMQDKQRLLDIALSQLGKRGRKKAEAEYNYRIALAKEQLTLRVDGYPATLVGDLARGNHDVAKLKMHRDIAEIDYVASLEAVNAYKLHIRMLGEQIDREWHRN